MPKERFVVKDLGDEGVMVYDQKQDKVHFLNPVAYFIWDLFKETKKRTLSEMEIKVREKFQSDAGKDVLADIKKCLKDLEEKKLILPLE